MAGHRDQIHESCIRKLEAEGLERVGVTHVDDLGTIIDEITNALARGDGLPVSSPLPGKSRAAAEHGRRRQHLGYRIETISRDFGVIAETIGELAAHEGLSFEAREYQVFNLCLDTAVGTALEEYWSEARAQQEHATTERVGFLVHELRNALSSTRMAFSVLKRGQMGMSSRTGEILERGLSRLDALIGQALLAVRLEAGLELVRRPLGAAALLHQLGDSAVPERSVSIAVEADEAIEVEADERILTSALSNLVQNAVKFTRTGGRVVLRARRDSGDVVFEVEDQCGGLPAGKLEQLFAPFVQRGLDRRGLGLGLAVTREAIEAHGGRLEIVDLPGCGCIFAVRLRSSGSPPAQ